MKLLFYYKLANLISQFNYNKNGNVDDTNRNLFNHGINFWEIIKPYLTLYSLPEIFSSSYKNLIKKIIKINLRRLISIINPFFVKNCNGFSRHENIIVIYAIPRFFLKLL